MIRENTQFTFEILEKIPLATEVLEAVRNTSGTIIDFRYCFLNSKARELHGQLQQHELLNRSLLTTYPQLTSEVFATYKHVVESGKEHKEKVHFNHNGLNLWLEATYAKHADGLLISYQNIRDLTTTEQQKQDKEALVNRLLESSLLGIDTAVAQRDSSGQIVDFIYNKPNARAASIHLQFGSTQVEGKSMLTLYPFIKEAGIFNILIDIVEKDQTYADELYMISDTANQWFFANYFKYGPDNVVISYLDITEQKKSQFAAHESKTLLESVFNATNVAIAALKAIRAEDGTITDFEYLRANQKSRELRSKEIIELNGKRLLENFPNVETSGVFDLLKQVVESGEPYAGQVLYTDGSFQRWFDVNYTKFQDGVVLTYNDITPIKDIEQQLLNSEHMFRSLVENTPDIVARLNLKLEYTFVNSAAKEHLGILPQDAIGKTPMDLSYNKQDTEHYVNALKEVISSRKAKTFNSKVVLPDRTIAFQVTIIPEFNEAQEVGSLLVLIRDISEQTATQQALEDSKNELANALEHIQNNNAKLQSMIDSTSELIFALDTHYRFIGFNKAFRKEYKNIFGVKAVLGDSLYDSLAHLPEEQMNTVAMWSRALQGEKYTLLQELGDRALERNYYELTFSPIIAEGNIIGASCVVRNLSTDRKIEKELKDAKEFLLLAENLPQLIFTKKSDGQLDYVNQAFYRYTGLKQVNFPTLPWKKLIKPTDYETFTELRSQHIFGNDKNDYVQELRLKNKQGEYQWMILRMTPLFDNKGILSKWLGTLSNIHLAKTAEIKQRQAAQEFIQLAEGLPQLVWMTRDDGRAYYLNRKWKEYAGEIELDGFHWINILHPDDKEATLTKWKQCVKTKKHYEAEYRMRSREGVYHWFLAKALPLMDLDGNVVRWFGTCTDIHEQKMQQLQLEENNKKLSELNEYLDTFVHTVAHDLRAPVVNMMGLVDLMRTEQNDPKEKKLVSLLDTSVHRLDRTLQGMIKLIELQSKETAATAIDVARLFAEIVQEESQALKQANAQISTDFQQGQTVNFIPSYLESTFRNLISNAIKYRRKEVALEINVSCSRLEDYILICFRDNGIGIDMDRFGSKIFRPFSRFTKQADGKGIGLHLIHNMFVRQGGKVAVESTLGKGTLFKLYIPV